MDFIYTDIVLIDSGVEKNHDALKNFDIKGISIKKIEIVMNLIMIFLIQ
ncbi:hypothetical protein [Streptobacillus moniliformis]|nr:hypothetical protein [Streptobacillus moniliformis]SQA13236.1 Uncharacterised protein [Streptobacillus moniliformis]SQA14817.1 Uncharacterised protein [Streptobacillus moniliformis]SQA14820.1 Uncharacterised protein [Streptobacillus moniliformis]